MGTSRQSFSCDYLNHTWPYGRMCQGCRGSVQVAQDSWKKGSLFQLTLAGTCPSFYNMMG